MPAVTFFSLLNEAYRMDARDKLELMNIALIPYIDAQTRQSQMDDYAYAARSPYEIIDQVTTVIPNDTDVSDHFGGKQ